MRPRPVIEATLLSRLRFFEGAAADALRDAARACSAITAQEGAQILDGGQGDAAVYGIVQGAVRITMRTASGLELVMGDLGPGEIFGEMAVIVDGERSASAIALCHSTFCRMPGECFLDLVLASPPLALRLMRLLAERVRAKDVREMELTALPVRFRLCADLLRLARPRAGGGMVVSPPPQQHILGARIGARREAVSRELAALARLGLVEVSRRAITLRDPDRMRAMVQAAYGLPGD